MKGRLRIEFDHALYHVLSRGVARLPVFHDDEDYEKFLDRLAACVEESGLVLYSWCLMTNHFHLLLETPRGNLSRWIKKVIGPYAQWFNERHERSGYLWEGRYKAFLVQDGSYLVDCSRYIHLNPCRVFENGAVPLLERYRWSSYGAYLGSKGNRRLVDTSRVLSFFNGSTLSEKRREYRLYVEEGLEMGESPHDLTRVKGFVWGDDDFSKEVGEKFLEEKKTVSKALRYTRYLTLMTAPSPAKVARFVEKNFADFPFRKRRHFKLYFMRSLTGLPDSSIARFLEIHPTTIGKSTEEMEKELRKDPEILQRVKRTFVEISERSPGKEPIFSE